VARLPFLFDQYFANNLILKINPLPTAGRRALSVMRCYILAAIELTNCDLNLSHASEFE